MRELGIANLLIILMKLCVVSESLFVRILVERNLTLTFQKSLRPLLMISPNISMHAERSLRSRPVMLARYA